MDENLRKLYSSILQVANKWKVASKWRNIWKIAFMWQNNWEDSVEKKTVEK